MDLRNRGDGMRMRYERERAPRWGGRLGARNGDDDAEGLCVKVGFTHPGRLDRPAGTAVLTGCSDRRVQGEKLRARHIQPSMVCLLTGRTK